MVDCPPDTVNVDETTQGTSTCSGFNNNNFVFLTFLTLLSGVEVWDASQAKLTRAGFKLSPYMSATIDLADLAKDEKFRILRVWILIRPIMMFVESYRRHSSNHNVWMKHSLRLEDPSSVESIDSPTPSLRPLQQLKWGRITGLLL